jgi:uncharacterized protein (DUF433 family)
MVLAVVVVEGGKGCFEGRRIPVNAIQQSERADRFF